jgi:hypothetical protein
MKKWLPRFVFAMLVGSCLYSIDHAQVQWQGWQGWQSPLTPASVLAPPAAPTQVQDQAVTALESRETFNVRLMGAKGNGRIDDTEAIRNAVAAIAKAGGGKLYFPNGVYPVSGPIDLPSGITVEGTNGQYNGNCRILLTVPNQKIFTIGENRRRISINNIELKAAPRSVTPFTLMTGTIGVDARGEAPNTTLEVKFTNTTFTGFDRGINVTDAKGQAGWQFDNVVVDHCTFADINTGIYVDTQNTDWKISNSFFSSMTGGYNIYLRQAGFVTIDTVIGGGPPAAKARGIAYGKAFIYVGGAHGTITIINSQCEEMDHFLELAPPSNYTYPITVINSIIGPKVTLRANCIYVSIGNLYHAGTVETVEQGTDVLIHSIGDVAESPPNSAQHPRGATPFKLHGNSRIVFGSGMYRVDFGNPTTFGRNVGIGGDPANDALLNLSTAVDNGVALRVGAPQYYYDVFRDTSGYLTFRGNQAGHTGFRFNGDIVPSSNRTGSLGTDDNPWGSIKAVRVVSGDAILSDKNTGEELYRIREDQNNIFFEDIRTGKQMMRLDRDGNLHVSGKIFQDSK